LQYHAQALAIASEIGAPLEEARALEGSGRCRLHHGQTADGTALLHQALTIYQRIKVPDARWVGTTIASISG
jgi:hypothetical protein